MRLEVGLERLAGIVVEATLGGENAGLAVVAVGQGHESGVF